MAAKFVLFAALYLVANVQCAPAPAGGDTDCTCDDVPVEETELLMQFIKEVEVKQDDPISPALITPQLTCSNCIEYNRKKRKTQPDSTEESEAQAPAAAPVNVARDELDFTEEEEELPTDYGFPEGYHDKSCPIDTLRQGRFCVPIPKVLLKKLGR
ncbi:hypothetical protein O0L34_g3312 [Tuta absoluta]|nr:hypothetical protein O0L34_g3312 [Tuta absoluta]